MKIIAPHISYEELGAGRIQWTVQERDYYQNDSGHWMEPDKRKFVLANGWHIFREGRVVCAVNINQGKVRIYANRHNQNKYIEFDFGLSLTITPHRDYVDIWREVPQFGQGSGFKLTIHGSGIKFAIRLTDKTLIPPYAQFNFRANGLTVAGRKIMDGDKQVFTMPNLFAFSSDEPVIYANVKEQLNGETITIPIKDDPALVAAFSNATFPIFIDPSISLQPTGADSYMSRGILHTNFGTNIGFVVRDNLGDGTRLLGRFDISSITPPVTVDSAVLSLYYYRKDAVNPVGRTVDINRLTETAWTELGVDWADQVHGSLAWSSGGGGTYTVTDEASNIVPAAFGWITWAVTNQVASSISLGSYEFLGKYDDENQGVNAANTWFYTKDYAVNTLLRPKLDIVTTILPGGIPVIAPPLIEGTRLL